MWSQRVRHDLAPEQEQHSITLILSSLLQRTSDPSCNNGSCHFCTCPKNCAEHSVCRDSLLFINMQVFQQWLHTLCSSNFKRALSNLQSLRLQYQRRQWLQYSCLENPMDGGAWQAGVHGVAKSQTRLSDFTLTFHFHALEKEMATYSSVLAWRIPGTGEPGGLPSKGSHRVGHN